MKKQLLLFVAILFFGIFIPIFIGNAKPVSIEYAKIIAEKWYKHYSKNQTFTIKDAFATEYEGVIVYYTFIFNPGGFVMVSADDASIPILAYSIKEKFDKNNIPPNAKFWFESYSKEIKYIIDQNLSNAETLPEWESIKNETFNEIQKGSKGVNPLCSTLWDQGYPYNLQCPSNSVTGCVATTMAQIMKKWNHPVTGQGSHSYVHPNYGTLSANFGATTYDWANMLNSYLGGSTTAQKNAVATLMYHCGVSVEMNYSPSGSGAFTESVPYALTNYFVYQQTAEVKYKGYFSDANWRTLLKEELDAGRPVFYVGSDGDFGHAFVCDGYDNSNPTKFHFNWGWSGYENGYYAIGSLNAGGYSFNSYNTVVVRITPSSSLSPIANFTASTTTPAINAPVTFTDLSTNNPTSWQWTFDGGTPSSYTGQNPPAVSFSTNGYHLVSLKVSNAHGSDICTKEHYINVGGVPSAWIKQNTSITTANTAVQQIFIVNPSVVWATMMDISTGQVPIREFIRTVNGGITWLRGTVVFPGSETYDISNIFAFSGMTAYICMNPMAGSGGKILKTIDGGATWTEQTTANFTGSWANLVHFFNTNDGVCMGDPVNNEFVIYTTTDEGNTWIQVPGANIPNANPSEYGVENLYDAVGDIIWFGTTKGRVFKSVDKGLNWTVSTTGLGTSAMITPIFKDANTGFVTGVNYSAGAYIGLKKTTDGGATWTTVNPTGYYVKNPNLDYVPGTASMWVNVASGPNKGSSYSLDDCASFLNIDTGSVYYTCVSFYDINTGWAGGIPEGGGIGGIYKWDTSFWAGLNKTATTDENIRIYPIPTKDIINISLGELTNKNLTITIYNIIGEVVLSERIKAVSGDILRYDLSNLNNGFYFLNIYTGARTITRKIPLIR